MGPLFVAFIPVVGLQSNENTSDHYEYLAKGIDKVLGELVFCQQLLTDLAEEFDHGNEERQLNRILRQRPIFVFSAIKLPQTIMKILKYILIVIVSLLVLLFAIGLLFPAVEYGYQIKVKAPVEQAWALSQDKSKFDQWLEGFKSIELISGKEGLVGSKYKVVVNPGEGQPDFEMIETLMAEKKHRFISFHYDSEMMDFEQTTRFDRQDDMTTITSESKVMGKGLLMHAMLVLMEKLGGSFTKQEAKNLEALKKLIDANTLAQQPAELASPDSTGVY